MPLGALYLATPLIAMRDYATGKLIQFWIVTVVFELAPQSHGCACKMCIFLVGPKNDEMIMIKVV